MRRRPIDVARKLPLIRSQKELALDDDTKVDAQQVRFLFIHRLQKNSATRIDADVLRSRHQRQADVPAGREICSPGSQQMPECVRAPGKGASQRLSPVCAWLPAR